MVIYCSSKAPFLFVVLLLPAPITNLSTRNQMILRLAEMSVVSEGSGSKAKISIMKSYPLTNSSVRARTQSISRKTSTSQHLSRPKPPRLLPSISRTPSTVSRASTPTKPPPQVDVAKFKLWAEAALNTQQQDIDRLLGSVDRIERDMRLFKDFMEEIRSDPALNQRLQGQEAGLGLATVRDELADLRQQVSSTPRPVSRGSFELSNRSLDLIGKDVQLLSQKVDEIETMKKELEQMKTRLNGFEDPAMDSSEEIASTSVNDSASTALYLKGKQIRVRDTRSQRKRNHDQVDGGLNSNGAQPLSIENCSIEPRQQINSRSRVVIEIPLSKGPSHMVTPRQDRVDEINYVEDEADDDYQPPGPVTPLSALSCTRLQGENGVREMTPLPVDTSLPLSERILRLNKVIEPDYRMLEKDILQSRKRASNGLLLTKDGKVDRRSLRFLGDQENWTPSRSSVAPEDSMIGARNGAARQLLGPCVLPIVPSTEQSESALPPRWTPQPQPGFLSSSITPRDQKPFKCGSCKKQYTTRVGLKYVSFSLSPFSTGKTNTVAQHMDHSKNAACRGGEGNTSPEEFTCEMCQGKFGDLQRLDKVRSYSCPFASETHRLFFFLSDKTQHRCRGEMGIKITLDDRERSLAYREATVAAYEATLADRERLVRQTLEREMSVAL
jgi:hypothetical protein